MELDRHLTRTVELQDAARAIPVEAELGVRVVEGEDDVVLPAIPDRLFQVGVGRDGRRGVVRVVQGEDPLPPG